MIIRNLEHYQIETSNNQLDRVNGGSATALVSSSVAALGLRTAKTINFVSAAVISEPYLNVSGSSVKVAAYAR